MRRGFNFFRGTIKALKEFSINGQRSQSCVQSLSLITRDNNLRIFISNLIYLQSNIQVHPENVYIATSNFFLWKKIFLLVSFQVLTKCCSNPRHVITCVTWQMNINPPKEKFVITHVLHVEFILVFSVAFGLAFVTYFLSEFSKGIFLNLDQNFTNGLNKIVK